MLQFQQLDRLVDRLVEREGGWVHHKADPGGETKYGISKRSYPHEDIKNLTKERAKEIYLRDFVYANQIDKLEDEQVAETVLDWIAHSGASVVKAKHRVKALQRLVGVKDDGVIGPKTIAAMNAHDPSDLVEKIMLERLFFLLRLTKHPFIVGWVKRLFTLHD